MLSFKVTRDISAGVWSTLGTEFAQRQNWPLPMQDHDCGGFAWRRDDGYKAFRLVGINGPGIPSRDFKHYATMAKLRGDTDVLYRAGERFECRLKAFNDCTLWTKADAQVLKELLAPYGQLIGMSSGTWRDRKTRG